MTTFEELGVSQETVRSLTNMNLYLQLVFKQKQFHTYFRELIF